ncbi:MAG: hypothetical protein IPM26_16635 [Saprospiraceae bacterium]|nr:hypothetical protein [Saprospiraceae bacterium]
MLRIWGSEILSESGVHVMVVNPSDILRSDKYQYQKSDKIDARMLCRLYRDGQLKGILLAYGAGRSSEVTVATSQYIGEKP